jgi:hypothetical protein
MIVKKTCSGLGKAITAALLILSCPTIPQDNVRNPMNNAVSTIVGLNLIFIITFNFFETQIYLFSDKLKTSTLRLRKLRNNLSIIMFRTKEKTELLFIIYD